MGGGGRWGKGLVFGLGVLVCLGVVTVSKGARNYEEDGDPRLYAWRTIGHHPRRTHAVRNSTGNASSGKIRVHLVPHAHLDVGWLKTVEECWYGANQSIQDAAVRDIIDSVVGQLALNPERKWTIGEQAFFQRWWREHHDSKTGEPDAAAVLVRRMIENKQLVFVDGGWSQHDTGCTHYTTMIDQTTFGQVSFQRNDTPNNSSCTSFENQTYLLLCQPGLPSETVRCCAKNWVASGSFWAYRDAGRIIDCESLRLPFFIAKAGSNSICH